VDVDATRQDEEAASVDDLACVGRQSGEIRLDRLDRSAADRHIRSPRAIDGDDGPADDQDVGSAAVDRDRHQPRIAAEADRMPDHTEIAVFDILATLAAVAEAAIERLGSVGGMRTC
jgi:hypothetical protein